MITRTAEADGQRLFGLPVRLLVRPLLSSGTLAVGRMARRFSSSASTASLLAARIVERLGYIEGLVDEAAPFADASDIVLVRSDGMTVSFFCIVDAEWDESNQFGMDRREAKRVLALCRDRHCGTVAGAKQPARLEIVELRSSFRASDLKRLKAFSNRFFDTDSISAFVVHTAEARAITATRWSFWNGRRRFLEGEMRDLRAQLVAARRP